MSNISVGQKIRSLRKERKLTLLDIAGETFTKGYMSHVELGKVNPSFKALTHIARKLDVDIEILLSDHDQDYLLLMIESKLECDDYEGAILLSKEIDMSLRSPLVFKIKVMVMKAHYNLGDYQACEDLIMDILTYKEAWHKLSLLLAHSYQALIYFNRSDYKQVIEYYVQVFEFAHVNKLMTSKLLANMYLNRATAYQNLDCFDQAIVAYHETLLFSKEKDCRETVLDVFIRISYCYYRKEDLKQARRYIMDAIRVGKVLEDKLPLGEAYYIFSLILLSEKNYRATGAFALKSLDYFEQVKRQESICQSLLLLAKIYKYSQDKRFKEVHEKCLKLVEEDEFNENFLRELRDLEKEPS